MPPSILAESCFELNAAGRSRTRRRWPPGGAADAPSNIVNRFEEAARFVRRSTGATYQRHIGRRPWPPAPRRRSRSLRPTSLLQTAQHRRRFLRSLHAFSAQATAPTSVSRTPSSRTCARSGTRRAAAVTTRTARRPSRARATTAADGPHDAAPISRSAPGCGENKHVVAS